MLAAWQATIVDERGDVQPEAKLEVRVEKTGALAAIYADRDGTTALPNPCDADEQGFVRFYAPGGSYRIVATRGEFSRTWRHVALGALAEMDEVPGQRIRYEITPDEIAIGIVPDDYSFEELDARRYGDNAQGIRAAIAVAIAKGGGTVKLTEGKTYSIDSDIDISGARHLTIDGQGATITPTSRLTQCFQFQGSNQHVVIKNVCWSPPPYTGSGSAQARLVAVSSEENVFVDFLELDHCEVTNGALITLENNFSKQVRCNVLNITNCKADGQGNRSNGLTIGGVRVCKIEGNEITGYGLDGLKIAVARVQTTSTLTNPFATTAGNYRVKVTHPGHSLLQGDRVDFAGATAVGGITVSGRYTVGKVIDANSYEIIHTAPATSTVAGGGGSPSVTVRYPLTEMLSIKRNIFHNNAPTTELNADSAIDIFGGGRHTFIEENEFHYLYQGIVFKNENNGGDGNDFTGDVTHAVVEKNKFFDVANPILIRLANHGRIRDNYFERCGTGPAGGSPSTIISLVGPLTDVEITGNTFKSNVAPEIRLNVTIVDEGLDLDEVHVTISGNKFYDPMDKCIQNTSSLGTRFLIDITDNWFFRPIEDVIELRGYGGSVFNIDNNYFIDGSVNAVQAVASTDSDVFAWGHNHFIDWTGTQLATVATMAAIDSVASRDTTVGSAARFSAAIASDNCLLSSQNQAIIASRRVRSNIARSIVAGDAASGTPLTANRKFQVLSATGEVSATGSFSGSATFTDYAEYFENLTLGVIPLGTIVALEGDKVRPAVKGDEILGVVSGTAVIKAGDSPFTWSKRFLTGEFGEPLYETVTDEETGEQYITYKQNPAWDPDLPQVARSERPDEWTCVGLLGQLHVRVSADVSVGDYVTATGEKAATETRLRCMLITQPFDADRGYAVAKCLLR